MGIHGAVQLAFPLLKQLRVSWKSFCLSPSRSALPRNW